MATRKEREQSTSLAVLSSEVEALDGRVTDLEEENEARRNSSEGIRRELADHRIEDAKAIAEVKAAIGGVESKLTTVESKLSGLWKLLLLLIAIGIVNGLIAAKPWH
jgi:predicted  nucleic acid-binding Zn-ribbon protein